MKREPLKCSIYYCESYANILEYLMSELLMLAGLTEKYYSNNKCRNYKADVYRWKSVGQPHGIPKLRNSDIQQT